MPSLSKHENMGFEKKEIIIQWNRINSVKRLYYGISNNAEGQ